MIRLDTRVIILENAIEGTPEERGRVIDINRSTGVLLVKVDVKYRKYPCDDRIREVEFEEIAKETED